MNSKTKKVTDRIIEMDKRERRNFKIEPVEPEDFFESYSKMISNIELGKRPDTKVSIYVTVEEFLANGGKLKKGRELFNSRRENMGYYSYTSKPNGQVVAQKYLKDIKNKTGGFPINQLTAYVKIQAIPIYE